ncbi:hypothetical protein PZ938_02940 [Luteipulveratus sp. YIM 133132]|uniref:hypothetical protein n=1 Tax=Luteipulveratus flavus TaxID=3031728 RepID=UPI0023AFCCD5|nr:hypothetical protein [Luteipulveratus sp. YIM 133132]MDE9364548.1 hypothetical protein [Luteipulveratus sp. YIM 133132]
MAHPSIRDRRGVFISVQGPRGARGNAPYRHPDPWRAGNSKKGRRHLARELRRSQGT